MLSGWQPDVNMSHADTWAAAHDGTADRHRGKLRKKLGAGKRPKPAGLVRAPGSDKDIVIHGHHRTLAAHAEGQPVWPYVGRVDVDTGPWLEAHTAQADRNR